MDSAERGADVGLDLFEHFVPLLHRPLSRHQDVHGNESSGGGLTGAQRMKIDAPRSILHQHLFDGCQFVSWQGGIHQTQNRTAKQGVAGPQNVHGHDQSHERIKSIPARGGNQGDTHDDPGRGPDVGHEVPGIRLQGNGAVLLADIQQDSCHAEVDARCNGARNQADRGLFEWLGIEEARNGGRGDGNRGHKDQCTFRATREILGLRMTVFMFWIGRSSRDGQHAEGDRCADQIDDRLQCIGQQPHRAGQPERQALESHGGQGSKNRQPRIACKRCAAVDDFRD